MSVLAPRLRAVAALVSVLSLVLVGLAAVAGPPAEASGDGFTARGSARQVYAVGLPAGARVTLVDRSGEAVQRRRADSLGGVLFRHVAPGDGYRVREDGSGHTSGPLTVHTDSPHQWNKSIYDQSIPDDGYGYLTTRDGTQLAYTVHPPTNPAGIGGAPLPVPRSRLRAAVPDAHRVLRLRLRRPRRADQRHRGGRQPDGLRGRRHQHARHRLLGRRVRLLRAAADPRRLRHRRDDRAPAVGARATRSA